MAPATGEVAGDHADRSAAIATQNQNERGREGAKDQIAAGSATSYEVDLAGKNDAYRAASQTTPPSVTIATLTPKMKATAHVAKTKPPYIEVETRDPSPKDLVTPKEEDLAKAVTTPKPQAKLESNKPEPKPALSRGTVDTGEAETTTGSPRGPATGAAAVTAPGFKGGGAAGPTYASPPTKASAAPERQRNAPAPAQAPAAAPPPPPREQIASDKAEKPADAKPAAAKKSSADDPLLAWAKGEHARAISVARNGNCNDAAKIAVTVQNRAPEYFAQYMATDRALKQCQQYINDARDKDAEQSSKARASKRVNSESPAPTSK